MTSYDLENFLSTIRHLDYNDIILTAEENCKKLEKSGSKPNKKESLMLADKIRSIISWIKTGKKPLKMLETDFAKLKPICENLIAKKQLKPEAIKIFQNY